MNICNRYIYDTCTNMFKWGFIGIDHVKQFFRYRYYDLSFSAYKPTSWATTLYMCSCKL